MPENKPFEPERPIETVILREPWEVIPRVMQLGSSLAALLRVRDVARQEGANATPFHAANAPGTFSYQYGTFGMRLEHVGPDWSVDRSEGVEGILNAAKSVRFVFCNVDLACHDDQMPKPRSKKGTGSERVCTGNLFGVLPHYAPRPTNNLATYYIMVDETGACELSRPVVSNETFSAFIERIYLSPGDDDPGGLPLEDDDVIDDFDPQVARKR
jgi:hypothetical protein